MKERAGDILGPSSTSTLRVLSPPVRLWLGGCPGQMEWPTCSVLEQLELYTRAVSLGTATGTRFTAG